MTAEVEPCSPTEFWPDENGPESPANDMGGIRGASGPETAAESPHEATDGALVAHRDAKTWRGDGHSEESREQYRAAAREVVTALASEHRADVDAAEKRGAVKALRQFADAHRLPWTVFLRRNGSPVSVNDLLRETADRIEAGQ